MTTTDYIATIDIDQSTISVFEAEHGHAETKLATLTLSNDVPAWEAASVLSELQAKLSG